MRAKSLMLLFLALGCGLVASIGITQVLQKKGNETPQPAGETETIFVALTDIGQGDVLNSQVLKLEQWPKDKVPPGAMTKIEDVEGRRTRTKLYQGEPILQNKLFSKGVSEQGATAMIPKGYRVVPVKVDPESGGSGMLLPGDRVDVLVHLKANNETLKFDTAKTILQDIKVFAVNDVFRLDAHKEDDPSQRKITAKTVSLLVTPGQAEKLTLAHKMGSIQLVMRSPEDDQLVSVEGATPNELFGDSEAATRQEEALFDEQPKPVESAPPDMPGFMELLKRTVQNTKAEMQPAAPREVKEWRVRVLSGTNLNDVVLEPDSSDSGGKSWRISDGEQAASSYGPAFGPQTSGGSGFSPSVPDPSDLEKLLGPNGPPEQQEEPPAPAADD